MKGKSLFLGGWVTALANIVAVLSVGIDPIQTGGFIIAMLIILVLSCSICLMLLSAGKESDGESATNWASVGSYALGAAISTATTIIIHLLALS